MSEIRDKLAVALHDIACGDRSCEPLVMGVFYRQADVARTVVADAADQDAPGDANWMTTEHMRPCTLLGLCGQCHPRWMAFLRRLARRPPVVAAGGGGTENGDQ